MEAAALTCENERHQMFLSGVLRVLRATNTLQHTTFCPAYVAKNHRL
jgi:hypothetical protein